MRSVLVTCPTTGDLVPTGVDTVDLRELDDRAYLLLDCLGCGRDHVWLRTDATITPDREVLKAQQSSW